MVKRIDKKNTVVGVATFRKKCCPSRFIVKF